MNLLTNIIKLKEHHAKRETLFQLRGMSERMLLDCDISPELLKKGIKAWPWKQPHESVPTANIIQNVHRHEPIKKPIYDESVDMPFKFKEKSAA